MAKTWGSHNGKAGLQAAHARRAREKPLSDRERVLAQGIVGGLSNTAAARKAGYGLGAPTAEILERPRVLKYINELRARAVERLDYTIDNLCARLEHIAYAALDDRQYAAAVS